MKKVDITDKQLQVLHLISEGYSSEEIAKSLGNSKKTIDSIRIEMLNRFQVRNAAQLVAYGFKKKRLKWLIGIFAIEFESIYLRKGSFFNTFR